MRPVQSATGVFGLLVPLPTDSTHVDERMVAVGYALPQDFFLRLSELQLGIGTFRANRTRCLFTADGLRGGARCAQGAGVRATRAARSASLLDGRT